MKIFAFAFILFGCITSVFAQGKEMGLRQSAPDAVLKGFIKNYGDEKVTWKETEGIYEGTFKLIGMPATAWYDSTATG